MAQVIPLPSTDPPDPPDRVGERLVRVETELAHLSKAVETLTSSNRLLERLTIALAASTGGLEVFRLVLSGVLT